MPTAAGSVLDRVIGLEIGADDDVVTPFEPAELLARVTAVLRRRAPARARWQRAGPAERDLLAAFLAHQGRVLSRDDLLDLAPACGDEPFDRSIDNRITRLRRKIEADPAHPELIETVRGGGWLFRAADEPH